MNRIITRAVLLLSLVSLFTDVASEMLYPIMPLYLKSVGFSVLLIGVLEGVAEATAGLSKGYFGRLSDNRGVRTPFVQLGYSISAISKPMLALFTFPVWVFLARALDRLGKGVRTGARDAMLSDEATPATKGRVFGFHRSMDTLGAVLGPAFALIYLHYYPGQYKALFLWAFIPGILAVGLTLLLRQKSREVSAKPKAPLASAWSYWSQSPPMFRQVAGGLLAFAMFNSSDMLLLLAVKQQGVADTGVLELYIFYNIFYSLASYPIGGLADRIGYKPTLIMGFLLFAVTYAGITFANELWQFYLLFFFYGLYAAATDSVSKAWISAISRREDTATALGTFAGFGSIAALVASSLAGYIWYAYGAQTAFLASAVVAVATAAYFWTLRTEAV